jgi:hypothetical protein
MHSGCLPYIHRLLAPAIDDPDQEPVAKERKYINFTQSKRLHIKTD